MAMKSGMGKGINMEMFNLKGKVAVITGATGTLGGSMAHVLAEAGCDIVVATRDESKGKKMADELLVKYDVDVLVLTWEAVDTESIKKLARDSKNWKGHVDVFINNAGGSSNMSSSGSRNFLDRSDEDIRRTIEINFLSYLFCCREFGKIMKEQGSGKIINIGSISGMVGRDRRIYSESGFGEQLLEYAAAKGGVIAMTRDLAAVLAPYGIYVNTISPGGFRHGTSDLFQKLYSERTPLGRMGQAEKDLTGAVLYLASSASDYVTGQNIVVDGGFTSWR